MLHRVLVHAHLEALSQTTGTALITMRLIHLALAVGTGLAGVLAVAADGALKESRAAVAGVDPVVFPGAVVAAHFAWRVVQDAACRERRIENGGIN